MNPKIRELQLEELDILKAFIKICEENNLKYYLMGGTLIGAVRHKGFIPWDDDIDVIMPREDYEKLGKVAKEYLPEHMKYIYFKDLEKPMVYFSRIESERIEVSDNSAIIKRKRNAWIDIFPLDGMPGNAIKQKLHLFHALFQRVLIQYSQYSIIVNQELKNRPLIEKILIRIGKWIRLEKVLDTKKCMIKLDKILKKYKYDNSDKVGSLIGAYKWKEIYRRELFEEGIDCEFENINAKIPKGYNAILRQMYGDYMRLPSEEDRNKHSTQLD